MHKDQFQFCCKDYYANFAVSVDRYDHLLNLAATAQCRLVAVYVKKPQFGKQLQKIIMAYQKTNEKQFFPGSLKYLKYAQKKTLNGKKSVQAEMDETVNRK